MKKIISFAVWGNDLMYLSGIQKNFDLMKKFYPDWQMNVYYDSTVPVEYTKNEEIKFIKIEDRSHGKMWRFYAAEESDIFISRDLDSRITEREVYCVNKWLETDFKILSILDHKMHLPYRGCPILAGMFGIRNKLDIHDMNEVKSRLYDFRHSIDQYYLRDHIYPKYKNDILTISFETDEYLKNTWNENFIGQGYYENDSPRYNPITGVPMSKI